MQNSATKSSNKIEAAKNELLREHGNLSPALINEAADWLSVLHSVDVPIRESVPPFIAYLARHENIVSLYYDTEKLYNYEKEAITAIAIYLNFHPAMQKGKAQFPSPVIQFTELTISSHPNFDLYLADAEGDGYWLETGRIRIKPSFANFIKDTLDGRITKCDTYGDFQLIVEITLNPKTADAMFDFEHDDEVKYYHIIEEGRGTRVSEFIEYIDDDKEPIDGLHEQSFA